LQLRGDAQEFHNILAMSIKVLALRKEFRKLNATAHIQATPVDLARRVRQIKRSTTLPYI